MSTLVKRTFWMHAKPTRSTEIFAEYFARENFYCSLCVTLLRVVDVDSIPFNMALADLIQRLSSNFLRVLSYHLLSLLVCFSLSRHPVFLCSTSTISLYHFPFVLPQSRRFFFSPCTILSSSSIRRFACSGPLEESFFNHFVITAYVPLLRKAAVNDAHNI